MCTRVVKTFLVFGFLILSSLSFAKEEQTTRAADALLPYGKFYEWSNDFFRDMNDMTFVMIQEVAGVVVKNYTSEEADKQLKDIKENALDPLVSCEKEKTCDAELLTNVKGRIEAVFPFLLSDEVTFYINRYMDDEILYIVSELLKEQNEIFKQDIRDKSTFLKDYMTIYYKNANEAFTLYKNNSQQISNIMLTNFREVAKKNISPEEADRILKRKIEGEVVHLLYKDLRIILKNYLTEVNDLFIKEGYESVDLSKLK